MSDNNSKKPLSETEEKSSVNKVKDEKIRMQKKQSEDYKKKYFEFYDDIKISDRQDW